MEVHDEWQIDERRDLSEASVAELYQTDNDDNTPKEVGTSLNQLVAG